METVTLKPVADESIEWSRVGAGLTTNYEAIDEATANGDTDYVWTSTYGDVDRYSLGSVPSDLGTSCAVRVKVWARADPADEGRLLYVTMRLGGSSLDVASRAILPSADYALYTFTLPAWDAPQWEKEWANADVEIECRNGASWVRVTKIEVEVDYYKLWIARPNGDNGSQGWSVAPSGDHYAAVDEDVESHDGDSGYVFGLYDGSTDHYDLSDSPSDLVLSKGVEARCVCRLTATGSGNELTLTPRVGGADKDSAVVQNITMSYQLYRVSHANWQGANWTRVQMNGATLKLIKDMVGKAPVSLRVTAVQLAISYDTVGAGHGSVLRPRLIEETSDA